MVLNTRLEQAQCAQKAITLIVRDGTKLQPKWVVNAAGLHAPALAPRFAGLDARCVPPAHYAKGNDFTLSDHSPFSRLIYPVPESGDKAAGLGVHLTIDLGGQAKFGPDVQWGRAGAG